eukprot:s274_g26.t1
MAKLPKAIDVADVYVASKAMLRRSPQRVEDPMLREDSESKSLALMQKVQGMNFQAFELCDPKDLTSAEERRGLGMGRSVSDGK